MLKILVGYLVIAAALGASVLLFTEREAADWSLAFACLVGVGIGDLLFGALRRRKARKST